MNVLTILIYNLQDKLLLAGNKISKTRTAFNTQIAVEHTMLVKLMLISTFNTPAVALWFLPLKKKLFNKVDW